MNDSIRISNNSIKALPGRFCPPASRYSKKYSSEASTYTAGKLINFAHYIIYAIIFCLSASLPLYAYLDPGTGSMLFSVLIAIVSTAYFVIKDLFFRLFHFFSEKNDGKNGVLHLAGTITFYSEGATYWNVFKPIIQELEKRSVETDYLTSDENDPALSAGFQHVHCHYIGKGNRAFFTLNRIKSVIMVMTTPGLDVLQIKRSRCVKHYVHITHSAAGLGGYHTFGVDYYDTVLTGGQADIDVIREIESKRAITPKRCEIIGCTYLDAMREQMSSRQSHLEPFFNNKKITILISPTWGSHGLLRVFQHQIIENILNGSEYNLIIRPHPQSFISERDLIEQLLQQFPESERLHWDRDKVNLRALAQSDIMISDFSGIIFDYLIFFSKPVIAHLAGYDKRGKDAIDLDCEPWEIQVLKAVGTVIERGDIDSLVDIIDRTLTQSRKHDSMLRKIKDDMDKYPLQSGVRGADALQNIINSLKE